MLGSSGDSGFLGSLCPYFCEKQRFLLPSHMICTDTTLGVAGLYHWVLVKVQTPMRWSLAPSQGGMKACLGPAGWGCKSWCLTMSPITLSLGREELTTTQEGWESQLPAQPSVISPHWVAQGALVQPPLAFHWPWLVWVGRGRSFTCCGRYSVAVV